MGYNCPLFGRNNNISSQWSSSLAHKLPASKALPTGTVTFLFTDIVGSTPLWESQPEKMAEALHNHNTALRGVIEAHGGVVFKIVGDAFQTAFPTDYRH
jgi:class 3 adenylate cyclase